MTSARSGWRPAVLCALLLAIGIGLEQADPLPHDRFHVQPSPQTLPSTAAVSARDIAQGTELLSLAIDAEALTGPRGLLTHPLERGREWERPGHLSYFVDGRLELATRIGVRLHGGRSRTYSPAKSYRLFFRSTYGPPAVPSSMFFPEGPRYAMRRIIAHNDVRVDSDGVAWHLVNPIAYDIGRRLGGIAPRTRPVRFFLNGEPQGLYVLTEPINLDFLEARFGHREFSLDAPGSRTRLFAWADRTSPFTMADVEAVVDLDQLTSWALTVLFCGTTDVMSQSPLVRDERTPDARWFWVLWDLDHSFQDLYRRAPVPWEIDSYRTILYNREGRSRILTRLLFEDPAYRRYFLRRLAAALNHLLTPAYLESRYLHHMDAAFMRDTADLEAFERLRRYLERRPDALWALSAKHLKLPSPYTVEVEGPAGTSVSIDGFETRLPYRGRYLEGTPFTISASPATLVTGWSVNGTPGGSPSLSFDVNGHVRIVAATAPQPAAGQRSW